MSFRAWVAQYTLDPTNFYKVTWDLCISFVYLMCYFIDPLMIAFNYEPLND